MRFSVAAAVAILGASSVSAANFTVKVGANNGVRVHILLPTDGMY